MPQPNPDPTPTPTPTPTPDPGTQNLLEKRGREIAALINVERKNRGLAELSFNADATALAKKASDAAAAADDLNAGLKFIKPGYGMTLAGSYGLEDPRFAERVVNSWMGDERQRSLLLRENIREIGVAVTHRDGTRTPNYVAATIRWI